jgi:acylphosphatase
VSGAWEGSGGGGREAGGGDRVAVRLILRGRVQGVGFRYFALRVARELGLAGRVRNLPNGRVEIEVAGDRERVEELKTWMRQGPPGAAVTELREEPLPEAPAWDRFEIDH